MSKKSVQGHLAIITTYLAVALVTAAEVTVTSEVTVTLAAS